MENPQSGSNPTQGIGTRRLFKSKKSPTHAREKRRSASQVEQRQAGSSRARQSTYFRLTKLCFPPCTIHRPADASASSFTALLRNIYISFEFRAHPLANSTRHPTLWTVNMYHLITGLYGKCRRSEAANWSALAVRVSSTDSCSSFCRHCSRVDKEAAFQCSHCRALRCGEVMSSRKGEPRTGSSLH